MVGAMSTGTVTANDPGERNGEFCLTTDSVNKTRLQVFASFEG